MELNYGNMPMPLTLNMGGFGGSSVLFLVDGERLAGETMDNVDYSRLNLENVGRVEIIKGAASALGADYMHDYLDSYQFKSNGIHTQSTVDAFAQLDFSPARWLNKRLYWWKSIASFFFVLLMMPLGHAFILPLNQKNHIKSQNRSLC